MQGIYKIINNINGNSYIGQSVDIYARWSQHRTSKKDYPLYRAFKKYGLENFTIVMLEEVEDRDKLTEREIFYYDKEDHYYNQMKPEGYNCYEGIPVYQIDMKTLEIINTYESTAEAARDLEVFPYQIVNALNRYSISAHGYYWCRVEEYNDKWEPKVKQTRGEPVYQIEIGTLEIVNSYDSALAASQAVGVSHTQINDVCLGKSITGYGYYWVKISDYTPDWKPRKSRSVHAGKGKNQVHPVNQYNKDTREFIQRFDSMIEAQEALGLLSISGIVKCCKGITQSSAGYKWTYAK
jgi:predicted GIY-YIG superfamily endonuclease